MARPSARVITSYFDGSREIDVLERPKCYCVLYQGEPISLRIKYIYTEGDLKRYPLVTFPSRAACANLARSLNKQFGSTEFTVRQLL